MYQGFNVEKHIIGHGHKPFVIAEMSANHNQSLNRAIQIVEAAAQAGVHALKLQTYTADTLTIDERDNEFFISDKSSLWYGKSLYELYQSAYTPWEWHEPIFKRCRELGIIAFSTPFDATAVNFLETLNVPLYKIASFDIINLELIKAVAKTGKPVIISTGLANLSEISEAVQTVQAAGCNKLVLLKCTSTYPASPIDSNILTIPSMHSIFKCPIGLSDHTLGIGAAIASIALGACVIEKHFTLSRSDGGVDSAFSMEPTEMKQLVVESERAYDSLGKISYEPTKNEIVSMRYRRSLYIVKDLKAGDRLNNNNIRAIRPGLGLSPKYYPLMMGKKINRDIKRGTPLSWDFIE
ncbi:TPA: pseudaminic acid synthase [Legionella pneumophila]|nr:pseudaminic acid synthase [Legionella pneumophila]HAT2039001.1 pseudaminic acid synthase [Legionella pneumophila]HBD7082060.1 pseudaminic acid synthase [Legionella pneumophila]HCU6104545.1 pseudaminic acid synthase [Legionella pneumophila]HEE0244211.1 pseudaminic acid synthase [Legionella pneumophila]